MNRFNANQVDRAFIGVAPDPSARRARSRGAVRRSWIAVTALASGVVPLLQVSSARADSPLASHRYLADPAHLVHEGRVYLYASNDDDNRGGDGYRMASFVAISSSDMKNWTDHGEVFRVPRDASWANNSWAPAAIERNGTIYLYFGNNAGSSNVASGSHPLGPFRGAGGRALVNASTPGVNPGVWYFDPAVFIDDDGQGYLYFGGNSNGTGNDARVIRLNEDMISVNGSAQKLTAGGSTMPGFFEASWMHKRGDVYYFSYSSPGGQQNIDYARGPSPTGPFEFKGTVGPNPPNNNNNNHHAFFEFEGKWYEALHNRDVARANGDPPGVLRNLALEELTYAANGDMNRIVYTQDGVEQRHGLNPYERVEAETTNRQRGIETEVCSEGGMNVTDIDTGDWIKLRGVDFLDGAKDFSASVAATSAGGKIELRLGAQDGTLIGSCDVPATGGDQSWETVNCDVSSEATGVEDLFLVFTGQFNFDYWQMTSLSGGNGTGGTDAGSSGGAEGVGGSDTSVGGDGSIPAAGGALASGGASVASGGGAVVGAGGSPSVPGAGGASPGPVDDGALPGGEDAGCACTSTRSAPGHGWLALVGLAGLQALRRRRVTTKS